MASEKEKEKKKRIVKNQRQIRSFRKYYKYNQEHGSCLKQDWLTRHLIFHFDALLRTLSLRNQTRIINTTQSSTIYLSKR